MRKTALDCVHKLSKIDERVVFVGSDLGPGVLDKNENRISGQILYGRCQRAIHSRHGCRFGDGRFYSICEYDRDIFDSSMLRTSRS